MGVVRWTTNQPPRMIRGSPSATPMHYFYEDLMIIVKEKPKKLANIDLLLIVIAFFISIAVLLVPYN